MNAPATFADFFEPGRNRLGTMRHVLALAVLVDHAFILEGTGGVLNSTGYQTGLGGLAVASFFVLSGALITASWEHSGSAWQFARNRVLRIFPGYLACLLVTALIIGPLAWALRPASAADYWKLEPGPVSYVFSNSLLMQFQNRIGDLFATHHEAYSINGSLWSIPWEAGCYAMVAVLGAAGVLRRWPVGVVVCMLAVLANIFLFPPGSILGRVYLSERNILLPVYFLAGASFYLFHHRIPRRASLGALALAGTVWGGCFNWPLTAAFCLPYLLFYVAGLAVPPKGFPRRQHPDFSYGIYIYAFPIQQLLVVVHWHHGGPIMFALLTTACVVPVAAASWFGVESKCLRLKRTRNESAAHPRGSTSALVSP